MKTINTIIFCMMTSFLVHAQKIKVDDVYPNEVASQGFTISQDTNVKISGTGGVFRDDWQSVIYYSWILNADTREVVWHLLDESSDRDFRDADEVFDYSHNLDLKKGNYEIYYTGARNNNSNGNYNISARGVSDAIGRVFDSRRRRRFRSDLLDELFVTVEGSAVKEANANNFIDAKSKDAIISFMRIGDDDDLEKGFNLTAETKLKLYIIGEGTRDQIVDHAWIQNAATRERVFEMTRRNTDYAGGADKNIMINETITLPAGSYVLKYSSDDSHSYEEWNAMPPDDPEFWGVNMWAATEADKKNIAPFVKPKEATPLLALTEARDNELLSQGMKLSKEIEVRVLCLGEGTDNMVDYGWIVNAETREKVWEMREYRTEHAGGAEKNRMLEEKITLPAGDYIVYYVTDDSHSYRDWNSAKPYEDDLWGISIWATNANDMNVVSEFDARAYKNKNVIAEITMVGNHEDLRESFELDAETKVRVIGIGEGTGSDMDDYGYIKNMDTGRIVWEMKYRYSDHAGGARKNREFNETISLEKGKYRVYFESDGSHAYGRWNADPPSNPEQWGISILKK